MPLSAEAFHAASRPRRATCGVTKVLGSLSDADRKVLEAALADPDVTHAAIERVLAAEGIELPQGTVRRHRHGECAC